MSAELQDLCRRFGDHRPGLLNARAEYAVLCPLLERPDGLHLLFEVRAAELRQGGEVCFPGGKLETGESPTEGALRETWEELHIPPSQVTVLGTPDFLHNPQGFLLHPILGLVSPEGLSALSPSPAEVAEVFTVPLHVFRETEPELWRYPLVPQVPADFPYASVGTTPDYPWSHGEIEVPIWHYAGHAIWGMTARLIRELIRA